MTEDFDPYSELGLPRTATEAEVRAAYRARAKATHPDNPETGGEEAFGRTQRALMVLGDVDRRRTYDTTGKIEEAEPDNARARALGVIEKHLQSAYAPFLTGEMEQDPREREVIVEMRIMIGSEIRQEKMAIEAGETVVAFLRDFAARFDVPDPKDNFLRRSIDQAVKSNEQQVSSARERIEDRVLALKMLEGCKFRANLLVVGEPLMSQVLARGGKLPA